ncbi:hypothetical protein AVEN_46949-1 [Araneus ventricosus]|uniref:Uncharacterized protein n=1 Tax=Araneus ventricosus TaxID=182803 RepID=A0A4Y2FKB8_ARAVE|nr:hypothetical protein AVEN_46949-1 [Araneus ventricosus]
MGLFWYPRLGWETSLFPFLTCGKSDVSHPNRGYQIRPPTFFAYLLLPPTQSTCRSLWTKESVSERGVRIRTGSPIPNPNGESESLKRNGFVSFGQTGIRSLLLRIRIFKFVPE